MDLTTVPGAPVRAPQEGEVTYAQVLAGRPVLVVAHPEGVRSTFEPVRSHLRVGDRVARGDVIGTLETGPPEALHCPGGCVHWGVLRGSDYLDPMSFLGGPRRVRLYPVPA